MVQLGTTAPAFELMDVMSGKAMGRDDIFIATSDEAAGDPKIHAGLLVMFVCPHCPYVKHLEAEIGNISRDYAGKIAMVAIQSNDVVEYPQDGPAQMKEQAERYGWQFPYLLDEAQEVARSYEAECTPDFFLFDANMELVYRGQMDESRPRRSDGFGNDMLVSGKDLREAMDAVVAGKRPDTEQRASIGCNIKWK